MSVRDGGEGPITDERTHPFRKISLEQGVELVWKAFSEDMIGGEIYIKKIPSMKIADIGRVIAPDAKQRVVGIRHTGEKLRHEQMVGIEDTAAVHL